MHTAYLVITLITATMTAAIAVADFIPARFVLANSAEVGVPRSWLRPLGATKMAGAVGLVAGLVGLPVLGLAAATGLVLFFVGAVATHLKARGPLQHRVSRRIPVRVGGDARADARPLRDGRADQAGK